MTKRIIKGFAQFVNENLSENRMESLSNQMQVLKDQGYTVAEYEPSGGTDALGYLTMDGDRIEVPYTDIDFDSKDAGLAEIIELIKEIASENGIDKVVFWDEDMIIDVEYANDELDQFASTGMDPDLYLDDERQNEIIADALGCDPAELDNYFIGSPVNIDPDDQEESAEFEQVSDLFDSDWNLKESGKLVYEFDEPAPDGFQRAQLFRHNGMRVVVVEAEDGPFIYVKPTRTSR
jgi:hypothetical protein